MKIQKTFIAIGLLIAFGLFFELAAHADDSNEQTQITFSEPFHIPGQILPAGAYKFQRAERDNPDIIQIFNADGVLEATVETIPAERTQPAGDTVITLAKAGPGNPDYLVTWFYPGRTSGHEFVYPKQQEQEIAKAPQQTVVANESSSTDAAGN